jgi:hypothetical protein
MKNERKERFAHVPASDANDVMPYFTRHLQQTVSMTHISFCCHCFYGSNDVSEQLAAELYLIRLITNPQPTASSKSSSIHCLIIQSTDTTCLITQITILNWHMLDISGRLIFCWKHFGSWFYFRQSKETTKATPSDPLKPNSSPGQV